MMRWAFLLVILAGIAACTNKTADRGSITSERLVRPETIYVYPFATYNADIPAWSEASSYFESPTTVPSDAELTAGRQLGAMVAGRLVDQLNEMGMAATIANPSSVPQLNDAILVGYFVAADEGSAAKRLIIGFGSGAAKMRTAIEGYQMTESGPRLIGSGEAGNRSARRTPGLFVPVIVLAETGNPLGLAVSGATRVAGEVSGKNSLQAAAIQTADEAAKELRSRWSKQGWI